MTVFQQAIGGFRTLFAQKPPRHEGDAAALLRLDRLSIFLDSAFRVPIIGTRVGADALLNFVPGAGLLVAKSLTAYIIWEAWRLCVPKNVIVRMVANLGIDFGISIVPVAGWVGDAFFRANLRNVALLKRHLHERQTAPFRATREAGRKSGRETGEGGVIEGEWVRMPG